MFVAVSQALGRPYYGSGVSGHKGLAVLGEISQLSRPMTGPAHDVVDEAYLRYARRMGVRHLVLPSREADACQWIARSMGIQIIKAPLLSAIRTLPSPLLTPREAMNRDQVKELSMELREAASRQRARVNWIPEQEVMDGGVCAALKDWEAGITTMAPGFAENLGN